MLTGRIKVEGGALERAVPVSTTSAPRQHRASTTPASRQHAASTLPVPRQRHASTASAPRPRHNITTPSQRRHSVGKLRRSSAQHLASRSGALGWRGVHLTPPYRHRHTHTRTHLLSHTHMPMTHARAHTHACAHTTHRHHRHAHNARSGWHDAGGTHECVVPSSNSTVCPYGWSVWPHVLPSVEKKCDETHDAFRGAASKDSGGSGRLPGGVGPTDERPARGPRAWAPQWV